MKEGGIVLFLVLQAYGMLIRFDPNFARKDFALFYRKVRKYRVRTNPWSTTVVDGICSAVDIACICYPKQVLCLQRSAAAACLLRQYGVPAQMIIGAQPIPFKAHAWVEVDGGVVNDKSYVGEMYRVLDRC